MMRKKKEKVSLWVHPEFRKAIKKKAIDAGFTNLLDFTEEFARELELKEKEEKKRKHDFGFF